jgi:hypothetical protein
MSGEARLFYLDWTPTFVGEVGESGYVLAEAFAGMTGLIGLHNGKPQRS